jgi:hypothetical protein
MYLDDESRDPTFPAPEARPEQQSHQQGATLPPGQIRKCSGAFGDEYRRLLCPVEVVRHAEIARVWDPSPILGQHAQHVEGCDLLSSPPGGGPARAIEVKGGANLYFAQTAASRIQPTAIPSNSSAHSATPIGAS